MQVKIMELESSFLFPSFLGKCSFLFTDGEEIDKSG